MNKNERNFLRELAEVMETSSITKRVIAESDDDSDNFNAEIADIIGK